MKLKLLSNWLDFYDHEFDLEGPTFKRLTNSGPDRRQMFQIFAENNIKTPMNGSVAAVEQTLRNYWFKNVPDLYRSKLINNDINVMIYFDEMAHCTKGKNVHSLESALKSFPNKYCSLYMPSSDRFSTNSYRYLQIGTKAFWLSYRSDDEYFSNKDGEIIGSPATTSPLVGFEKYPLLAIDFVCSGHELYAIDLNIAPGMKDTGIEKILSPKMVVDEIKNTLQNI